MQPSARARLKVGLVALVVVAVAIAWMLTRQSGTSALSGLGGDLRPPRLIELKAKSPAGERALSGSGKPEVKVDEVLDFQVEVPDQCWVYVFREQAGTTGLAWGHALIDEAWNPGVYAPEWVDSRGGMPFTQSGTVRLFAIASPTPLGEEVKSWDVATLENVKSRCSRCGVSTLEVSIAK